MVAFGKYSKAEIDEEVQGNRRAYEMHTKKCKQDFDEFNTSRRHGHRWLNDDDNKHCNRHNDK
jgi:hypothetical protein